MIVVEVAARGTGPGALVVGLRKVIRGILGA
jgi:hypothetical protein